MNSNSSLLNKLILSGVAIPVDFSEIGHTPGKLDPVTKVPLKTFYNSPGTLEIPKVCINDLEDLIEKNLSNIKKIKWEKPKRFVYSVEYHPIEGIEINIKTKEYRQNQHIGFEVRRFICEKFPHYILHDDNYDDDALPDPIIPGFNRFSFDYWFKMDLRIMFDPDKDCYLLDINRLSGESCTFYHIYHQIKSNIKHSLIWLMRKSYVSLLEGLEVEPDKEEVPIERYLLDEYICRGICSYLYCEDTCDKI